MMKYTMRFFAAALMTAALALSCNKTAREPVSQPDIRTFTCAFGASENPDSKVSVPDNGKAVWKAGDKIFVHGKEVSTGKVITLTSSDITNDGKTAKISVDVSGMTEYAPDGYYAHYPADSYVESDSDRAYYYGRWNNTNSPLMAAYLSGDTFLFYNLCGIITFSVTGDYDTYVLSGNSEERVGFELYQVKIVSNDKNYQRSDGTSGPLTSVSGPVTGDGTTVHQVCLPNGTDFTTGFTIKFLKSGSVVKTVSVKAVNVARGKVLPLGDVTDYLKDYVPPVTHNSSIKPVPTDASDENLSKTGSANCYIVNGADASNGGKIFKFKAVQGNSSAVLSTIESAVILWETYNNTASVTKNSVIAAADYDLQEGGDPYIVFQMPETLHAGNAVIAAKNGADEIIWSWHVWVPETAVSDISESTAFCGYEKIQDRNLGALNVMPASGDADPTAMGLYYQWGRKDPFPSNSAFTGSTPITVQGTGMSKHNGLITADYSVQHPTEYAYVAAQDDSDWNADHTTTLWENSGKTIYDPCPAGYRVPKRDSSKAMWATSATGWDVTQSNRVIYGSHVFPIAGYIDCYGGSYYKVGLRTHVWSATNRAETNAYCFYYKEGSFSSSNFNKAKAGSVRCVKE